MSTDTSTVLLIHGLASHPWFLRPLAQRLRHQGANCRYFGYQSLIGSVERHCRRLCDELSALEEDANLATFDVVGHSLGNILLRRSLLEVRPSKLRRVVMIAPPNHGSKVARFLSGNLGRLVLPLQQLSDAPDSFVNQLPNRCECEFGIIAARRDSVVHVDSTPLANQREHIVLRGGHTSILFRRETCNKVGDFLFRGSFDGSETSQT